MRRCAIPGCVVLAEDWVWCPFHGDTILKERIRAEEAEKGRVGIGAAHHHRAEARGVGFRPWLVDFAIEGGAL